MNIDQSKLTKVTEALGWLQQAEKHYRWLQHEIADSCLKKAKAALDDEVFKRQPIPGFSRNEQPEVVRVVADTPLGFAIINGADFDGNVHQLYLEEKSNKRIR